MAQKQHRMSLTSRRNWPFSIARLYLECKQRQFFPLLYRLRASGICLLVKTGSSGTRFLSIVHRMSHRALIKS